MLSKLALGGMMRTSIGELKRMASGLAYAGKHKKAAHIYEQILKLAPSDAQVALKLAETRRRLGDLPAAQRAFERAATLFKAAGLDGKAEAVERLVSELSSKTGEHRVVGAGEVRWWRRLFA